MSKWGSAVSGRGKKLAATLEKHGSVRPRVKKSSVLPPLAQTAEELIWVGLGRDGGSSGGDKEVVVTLSHKTAVRGTEAPTKCYFGAKRSHFAVVFSGESDLLLVKFSYCECLNAVPAELMAFSPFNMSQKQEKKRQFKVTKSKALYTSKSQLHFY